MIHDLVLSYDGFLFYGVILAVLIGSAFGLPIPEDVPLIAAGVAWHQLNKNPIAIFFVCYLGIVLSDLVLFQIGRKLGPKLLKKRWFRSKLSASHLHSIRHKVNKNGIWMIFIARHLFYLRSVTFVACGAIGMSRIRFLIIDAAAAVVSVPLMIAIGYTGSENFDFIRKLGGQIEIWVLVPLLLIAGLTVVLKQRSKKKQAHQRESGHQHPERKGIASPEFLADEKSPSAKEGVRGI